ncbi:MAG: HAD family hydrolase [Alicyclobacillus herbarius]|uniref:HAD family hydrolase n=1 Tax=Alicyclobacillus herbarius TaxID=122960 RepID=UPI000402AFEF|nr:HAD family hydrolase [Alicyclobacillus herbarius]MCL6631376.1 HAD family hydrolase [Alicyclobacillus herbarius]
MLTTLLFDLDGTLLPMDLDEFMRAYFEHLVPRIAHVLDEKTAVREIWNATTAMIENEEPNKTNLTVLKERFLQATGLCEEQIWPLFDQFYEEGFRELRSYTSPTPLAREICQTAHEKGYQLVIATNPIFPERAIRHRMEWAGVGDIPFQLVTTLEDMHFCKPNPKYFVEIVDKLDVSPFSCIMFGNDVQEDGVAGKLGIETYLVTDCLIDHGRGHFEFTHQGSLADVLMFIRDLPKLEHPASSN